MQPPSRNWNPNFAQQKRHQLENYLSELVSLPLYILESLSLTRFLQLKGSDIETHLDVDYDASELILNLIGDYFESGDVKLVVIYENKTTQWDISDTTLYPDLLQEIETKLNIYVPSLCYEDECQERIQLYGNCDLQLLLRTSSERVILYVVESTD